MSDETPQKGWDTWFGGDADSSGDEQRAPEQAAGTRAAPAVRAVPVLPQRREAAPPAPATVPEPELEREPESEPESAQVPAAPPETEAEQTSWTVPTYRPALEDDGGDDAQATQLASPKPAAVPPPRYGGAHSGRVEAQGTQAAHGTRGKAQPEALEQGSDDQAATQWAPQRLPGDLEQIPDPDQVATQWTPQGIGQETDQAATQWASQRSSAEPEQKSNPDQVALQWAPQGLGQETDQVPTQWAPQRLPGEFEQGSDQTATQWSPRGMGQEREQSQAREQEPDQISTQYVGPPASAQTAAPAWQTPQPAQMWSATQTQRQGYPGDDRGRDRDDRNDAGQRPPQGPGGGGDEWSGWDEEPERRRSSPSAPAAGGGSGDGGRSGSRRKLALASGVGAAGIVALVTVLLLNQTGSGGAGAAAKPSGFQPTSSTVAGDAQETAAAFLSAWESGNFQQAANYTDNPAAALSMLTAYKNGLNLAGLQLTAQSATADPTTGTAGAAGSASASSTASGAAGATKSGSVKFGVAAKVGLPATATGTTASGSASASGSGSTTASASSSGSGSGTASSSNVTGNWSYSSKLTAYERNGGWWIKWDPSLVAPNLTAGEKIVSIAIPPTASEVTDSAGSDLSNATDPGVRNIAAALKKAAPVGQGTPGVEIELEGADGKPIASTSDVLSQPVPTGAVKTTINPTVEAAAQAAVGKYTDSSMVVIKPSTGEILAVANNDGQNDFALTARVAPGSTNKIITSTALLTNNLVSSPSQAVACPKSITVNGTTFANSEGESEPASTPFLNDFAVSCNNAFGSWYDKIGSSTLAQTAQKYYGLNQQWDIGLGAAGPYYTIPSSSSNGELFQELFGQGQLEAAPIAMASVAATVDTGTFKQPIVVSGAAQLSATPLPTSVQQDLWQMMKAVTTQSDGTAYGVFSGVSSQVYGKTGTADVGSGSTKQQKPNSWMVVFDPTLDIAIACVVLNAGYGASFAGPETASVLKALQ